MNTKTQRKGAVILLLTAFIWGIAFTAQSKGMESIEAFTFNGIRLLMGTLVLIPIIIIRDIRAQKNLNDQQLEEKKALNKKTTKYGILLGVILFIGCNFQQQAFAYTSAGKIAFITTLYIFFVPLLGLFVKKRTPLYTWISITIGFSGLFLLCSNPKDLTNINKGDLLAMVCAFVYAIQILAIEKFVKKCDLFRMSFVEFIVAGGLSCIFMFIYEHPHIHNIIVAAKPLLYAGLLSCGVAYTLQVLGQKYTEATIASLLMCMEAVFGAVAAVIILGEHLTKREISGCIIMFTAIILSQLSEKLPKIQLKRR